MRRVVQVLLVGIGGATGAGLRLGLLEIGDVEVGSFPWPTLVANVVGSGLLGAIASRRLHEQTSWLFGAGLCGGLTTMSTFAVEVVDLADNQRAGLAVLYLITSLLIAFVAYTATFRSGRRLDSGEAQR